MVNINGISKGRVLAELYNASRPLGLGFLHYDPTPMTECEANELLKHCTYFDYIKGRVIKVDLSNDSEFDETLYDRDNGIGAAQKIINKLR